MKKLWLILLMLTVLPSALAVVVVQGDVNSTAYVTTPYYNITITEGVGWDYHHLTSDNPSFDWAERSSTLGLNYITDQASVSSILVKTDTMTRVLNITGNNTGLLILKYFNNASKGNINLTYYFTDTYFYTDYYLNVSGRSYDYHKNSTNAGVGLTQDRIYNSTTRLPALAAFGTNVNDTQGITARYYNGSSNYTLVILYNESINVGFGYQASNISTSMGTALGRAGGIPANTTFRKYYKIIPINRTSPSMDAAVISAAKALKANIDYGNPHAPTTYYFNASGGNDAYNCTSPALACKTIAKLNQTMLDEAMPGDTVAFAANEQYSIVTDIHGNVIRPQWMSGNATHYFTYTSYGTSDRTSYPNLTTSIKVTGASNWTNVGGNVWMLNANPVYDIGNVIFSDGSVGYRYQYLSNMTRNKDFVCNTSGTRELYVYSTTNPGTAYPYVELVYAYTFVNPQAKDRVIFEKLHITKSGMHGIDTTNTNTIIRHNIISLIGGGYCISGCTGFTRWGNGIQLWYKAKNITVFNNTLYEIYDAALTTQTVGKTDEVNFNHTYSYNTVYDSTYGFEYIQDNSGHSTRFTTIDHNTFTNMGGSKFDDQRINATAMTQYGTCIRLFGGQLSSNFTFTNNLCYGSNNYLWLTQGSLSDWGSNYTINYNAYFKNTSSGSYRTTANFGRNVSRGVDYTTLAVWQANTSKDANSVTASLTYNNPTGSQISRDYSPITGSNVCTASSTGSYVGSSPCVADTSTIIVTINTTQNNSLWTTYNNGSVQFYFTENRGRTANCTLTMNSVAYNLTTNTPPNTWTALRPNATLTNGDYATNVTCISPLGSSATSSTINISVESPTYRVTNLRTTQKDLTYLYLAWTNPEDVSWSYNDIYVNAVLSATGQTGTTLNITGLSAGTEYNITVRSYDSYGNYATNTITNNTRSFARWSGYSPTPFNILRNYKHGDPAFNQSWEKSSSPGSYQIGDSYDQDYTTYDYIVNLDIGQHAYINLTTTDSQYARNENTTANKIEIKTAWNADNYTGYPCNDANGKYTLLFYTERTGASAYNNVVNCYNATGTTTVSTSTTLANAKYYDAKLYRYYTTEHELTIEKVYALNGSEITGTITACNLATTNCTTGTTPLYLAMLNGTQLVSLSSEGHYITYHNITVTNNRTMRLGNLTNTYITWRDTSTNATTRPANCYYNLAKTLPINRTDNYYYLPDGTNTIYCTNGLETTSYLLTKTPLQTLNTTQYIDAIKMNVTFYYDNNLTLMTGPNISMDMISSSYSNTYTTTNGRITIAELETDTYLLRYTSAGYTRRFYSITITEDSTTLDLYLLSENLASNKTIKVIDETTTPVPGAVVKLLKYDLASNTYKVREAGTTDNAGLTTLSVTLNDEYYKFMVEHNGDLKLITSPAYIKDTATQILQIGLTSNIGSEYYDYASIDYSLQYNPDSEAFRLDYNDATGQTRTLVMELYSNVNGTRTLLNTSTIVSPAGTILLPVRVANGTLYEAYVKYIDGIRYKYLGGASYEAPKPDYMGTYGVLLQIFLTMISAAVALASTALAVILVPASLLIGKAVGLNVLPYAGLIPLQIVGIIIAIIVSLKK